MWPIAQLRPATFACYGFVKVMAVFVNPDPFRVPVIDLPLTVAVRLSGLNPGADIVRPTVGAE